MKNLDGNALLRARQWWDARKPHVRRCQFPDPLGEVFCRMSWSSLRDRERRTITKGLLKAEMVGKDTTS